MIFFLWPSSFNFLKFSINLNPLENHKEAQGKPLIFLNQKWSKQSRYNDITSLLVCVCVCVCTRTCVCTEDWVQRACTVVALTLVLGAIQSELALILCGSHILLRSLLKLRTSFWETSLPWLVHKLSGVSWSFQAHIWPWVKKVYGVVVPEDCPVLPLVGRQCGAVMRAWLLNLWLWFQPLLKSPSLSRCYERHCSCLFGSFSFQVNTDCFLSCNVSNENTAFPVLLALGDKVMKPWSMWWNFWGTLHRSGKSAREQPLPFDPPLWPLWNMHPTLVGGYEVKTILS